MLVDKLVELEAVITSVECLDHLPALEVVQGFPFNVVSLTHVKFFFMGVPVTSMASVHLKTTTKKILLSTLY